MDCRLSCENRYGSPFCSEMAMLAEENKNLHHTIEKLEKMMIEDRAHEASLGHENFHLKNDLSAVEKLSRSIKQEKEQALLDADIEMTKMQNKIKQLEIEKDKTNESNFNLSSNFSELQHSTKMIESDLKESQELITRLKDDKVRLSQRIDKLTSNERALVLEIERHKRRGKSGKSRESMSELEQYMKGIEDDRDYWKNEAMFLRELQRKETVSPTHNSTNKSIKKQFSKEKKLLDMEKEKDVKSKHESIRQEKAGSPVRNRSPSPSMRSKSPNKNTRQSEDDIVKLKRERDNLRNLLNKLEKRVGDIQSSVKMLNQEKDRYCHLYEESRKEIHRMHQEFLNAQEDKGLANSQVKKMLNRVEIERDGLHSDLARLQMERDNLLERFKVTVDTANHDKFLFEQKIEELSNAIKNARSEKMDMTERMDVLRARIMDLENELKNLEVGARQNMSELENKKEDFSQLKQQLQKTELHLSSAERQVANLTNQLSKSEEKANLHEQKIHGLIEDLRVQRDDFSRLRSEANRLDEDKDQLKINLNETTHRLHQVERDLVGAEDELRETRDHLCTAEQQLGRVSEILATSEKENRQLRKKGDNYSSQIDECQRKIAMLSRENERLLEEAKESQRIVKNMQNELHDVIEERDELIAQVQNYVAEVKAAEDLLAQREQDQNELLNRYQLLSEDADLYKQKSEMTNRDLNSCKQELVDRENDLDRLHSRIHELENEITERKFYNRELESKMNHLGSVVNQNKEQVKQIQHERDELMADLSALRDLCGRLERSKDELEKDIDSKNLDIDQLHANIEELENENESVKDELYQKQENLRSIETVLQGSQSMEQNCMMEIQEKTSEITVLNERLQMSEEKLLQSEREIQKLRNKNSDLERESERIQRTLSQEKFEKDRALSELRIHSLSSTYKPSSYLTNGVHRSPSPCRTCSP